MKKVGTRTVLGSGPLVWERIISYAVSVDREGLREEICPGGIGNFLPPFPIAWTRGFQQFEFDDLDAMGELRFNAIGLVEAECSMPPKRREVTSFASCRERSGAAMKKGSSCKEAAKSDWRALDAMSDDHRAAASDPDAPPPTGAQLVRARRVPSVRTLRQKLNLTQEEFAAVPCRDAHHRATALGVRCSALTASMERASALQSSTK